MNPPGQLIIDALHTATLHIYIERERRWTPSQLSTEALHTAKLLIYREGRWTIQSIKHKGFPYCYTAYIYIEGR